MPSDDYLDMHDWVSWGGQSRHPPLTGGEAVDCTIWRCTRCRMMVHRRSVPCLPMTGCPSMEPPACSRCGQPAHSQLRDFWDDLLCAPCRREVLHG
jgi:hypothetical protein